MKEKNKSKRQSRKELLRNFDINIDFERLDLKKRSRAIKGKSKLLGVIVATIIYTIGFAVGQYGWTTQAVSYDIFFKLIWLWMIPATVIGVMVWQITYNRREYPIRQDIQQYVDVLEGQEGFLWRYAPFFSFDTSSKSKQMQRLAQAIEYSKNRQPHQIAPEDYLKAMQVIAQQLNNPQTSQNQIDAILNNFE